MSNKKYDIKVFKEEVDGGSAWTAQIVRRVTSRKQAVSKANTGFASEALASAWAQEALAEFVALEKSKKKSRD